MQSNAAGKEEQPSYDLNGTELAAKISGGTDGGSMQIDGSAWMPAEKQGPLTTGAVYVFLNPLSIQLLKEASYLLTV